MNQKLKIDYNYYLSKFKNNIFSSKKYSEPKALTPSHYHQKKIFLSKEKTFLPPKSPEFLNKKTLILDLDETLVHSSFEPFPKNDIVLNVNFEGIFYKIYVLVRPGVEEFIKNISKYYELVVFTASLSKYASPLLDILDKDKKIQYKLYRDKCTFLNGVYIKPLKKIGRNLKDVIIVDNSPLAYAYDNENGLPISSWFDDKNDKELFDITILLEFLSRTNDVRKYIRKFVHFDRIDYSKAYKIIEEEGNIENIAEKDKNNDNENNSNIIIPTEDKNYSYNNNENLNDNIFNKNNTNIYKNKKNDIIDKNAHPLKLKNILTTKKDSNPIILFNNINKNKKFENKLPLYQNINLNDLEINNKKNISKDKKKPKNENNLKILINQQKNYTFDNDNDSKKSKKSQKILSNLTQRALKDKLISKKESFKNFNRKKFLLCKDLNLAISNTCRNIFEKNKKFNGNFLNSKFNLYNNKSNLNIFNINKDKLLSTNNNINAINQYTFNYNTKYKDLFYQYNSKIIDSKIKNKFISSRNKAIIFSKSQSKINKRIYSSLSNKDFIKAKNKINQGVFTNKNIQSRSSKNIYKKNINNKINTEVRN